VLQARISIFETVASDKLQVVRAKPDKLYKSLETLFSVDGGPLTVDLRGFLAQRALRPLMILSAMRLILKWFFIPAKRALRPRTFLRAMRPGVIFASLASADAFRRLASNQLASLSRVANLSTKPFLDCLCLPGAAETGVAEGETGLCEAKTGHRR
jgi:hypothetical protein